MPKGKSQSNEALVDGHSSMRRLSSLASLHQLNPFSRSRRTTTSNEDNLASDFSSASTSSVQPSPCESKSNTRILQETSHNIRPAPPHAFGGFLRKSSYVSIPDDSAGGIPRSKTFSNLPMPIKSRKRQNHAPSDTLFEEPSLLQEASRLPTPADLARRHLPFGRSSNISERFGGKLPRSDTEPLLVNKGKQKMGLEQALKLKENLPVHPANRVVAPSDTDLFGSSLTTDEIFTSPLAKQEKCYGNLPRHPSFSGAIPKSSPAFTSKPARRIPEATTTKAPGRLPLAQRWNSQPNLFRSSNGSVSQVADSRGSARHGPTPPPYSVSSFADELTRSLIGEPSYIKPRLEKLDECEGEARGRTRVRSARDVVEAQPMEYWAGRLSTLLDFAKNEETAKFFAALNDDLSLRYDSDSVYDKTTSITRIRAAMESLHACCLTQDARESFVVFQLQYAALHNEPDLAKPVGRTKPVTPWSRHSELSKASSNTSTPSSSSRSVSFVNRLLGRGKRSSIAS